MFITDSWALKREGEEERERRQRRERFLLQEAVLGNRVPSRCQSGLFKELIAEAAVTHGKREELVSPGLTMSVHVPPDGLGRILMYSLWAEVVIQEKKRQRSRSNFFIPGLQQRLSERCRFGVPALPDQFPRPVLIKRFINFLIVFDVYILSSFQQEEMEVTSCQVTLTSRVFSTMQISFK